MDETSPLTSNSTPGSISQNPKTVWVDAALLFRCIVGGLIVVLCSGIISGYVSLKPVLIDMKVYFNLCGDSDDSCDKQILQLNLVIIVVAAGVNALAAIVGVLADKFRPRTMMVGCSVIWAASCAVTGVAFGSRSFDKYFWWVPMIGLLSVALSGAGMFFVMMKFVFLLPEKYQGQLNAFLTASWDLSAAVFVLFAVLYDYTNISLLLIFCGYAGIVFLPLFLFAWNVELPQAQQVTAPVNDAENTPAPVSLKDEVFSLKFLGVIFYMSSSMLFQYFYISTFREQTIWLNGGEDNHTVTIHNTAFSFMLPLFGFGSNFLFGMFVRPTTRALIILAVSAAIFGALSCVPFMPIQFVTYSVFIPWRIFSFIVMYSYVMENFSQKNFATLASINLSISGFLTFASYGLDALAETVLDGSFFIINVVLTTLVVAGTCFAAYLSWKQPSRQGYQQI